MIEDSRRTGALRRFASDDAMQRIVEEDAGRLRAAGQARHGHFDFETVQLLAPADWLRKRGLKVFAPWVRPFIRSRALRVGALGLGLTLSSLALAVGAPLFALAVGPLIFGVPHLLADLRYLVVRPGLHRRRGLAVAMAIPLLAVALTSSPALGAGALVAAALFARASWKKRAVALALALLVIGLSAASRERAALIFAHLHNAVAILLWWAWRPRGRGAWMLPLAVLLASAAISLGAFDALAIEGASLFAPEGLPLERWERSLAPGLGAPWGLRLVLLFAFAQALHYGIWLRLVPEDDRPQRTPRPFAASWRALLADFGLLPLGIATALGVGLLGWALFDLGHAQRGYFRLALFHGYLELGIGALWILEGRLGDRPAPARG